MAEEQAWKDYYHEVVHPTGRFKSYEDYEDELEEEPEFEKEEEEKQAEWRRGREQRRATTEAGDRGAGGAH